ncbi:MAG: hypothetical protein Q9227_005823 [Pyrenula ochraceoflavens]
MGRPEVNPCHTSFETHRERDREITELCFEIVQLCQSGLQASTSHHSERKKRNTSLGSASTGTDDSLILDDTTAEEPSTAKAHSRNNSSSAERTTKKQRKEHKRLMKDIERKAGGLKMDMPSKSGIIGKKRIAKPAEIDEVAAVLHSPEMLSRMCGKSDALQRRHSAPAAGSFFLTQSSGADGTNTTVNEPPEEAEGTDVGDGSVDGSKSHIFLWAHFRDNPDPSQAENLTRALLDRLNVDFAAVESARSNEIKCVLDRLQRLIEEDLTCLKNELRDVRMRERSYWTYVGKDAWKSHWERLEQRDWVTGSKIGEGKAWRAM